MRMYLLGIGLFSIVITACASGRSATPVTETGYPVASRAVLVADNLGNDRGVRVNYSVLKFAGTGQEEFRLVHPEIICAIDHGPVRHTQGTWSYEVEARTDKNVIVVRFRCANGDEVEHEGTLRLPP